MFREISVSDKATKIPLQKEILNVSNSYLINVETYELQKRIDEEIVFILQLKYISTNNEYSSFIDNIWLQHKSKSFLESTVNVLFRAFDCDGFIEYNKCRNQFAFKFETKQDTITLTKYMSLSRKQHTKHAAKMLLEGRFETMNPSHIQIECVNSHEINQNDWDFEVNLTVLPATYTLYIDNLFGTMPIQIHLRDYQTVRVFYENNDIDMNIFGKYLNHLSNIQPRDKMMEWNKYRCESGPLFSLCCILFEMDANGNDWIWNDLFKICWNQLRICSNSLMDTIENSHISQQTVADFISLSLVYQMQNKGLYQQMLSETDRYILSIVSSYFCCTDLKTIHESLGDECLMSGAFNYVCQPLKIQNRNNHQVDDEWMSGLRVRPLDLKNKLLQYLHHQHYGVINRYYIAVLHRLPVIGGDGKTKWTFYIRPASHSDLYSTQIVYGYVRNHMDAQLKVGCFIPNDIILELLKFYSGRYLTDNVHTCTDPDTFMNYFEFEQRNMSGNKYLSLLIKCMDVSFEYEWALWTKKRLKLYSECRGYWKLLSTLDEVPRVPVDELDCILTLLRHKATDTAAIAELFANDNYLSMVFFKKIDYVNTFPSEENIESEYRITFWNGDLNGNSSLSLRLIKASHPFINNKQRLKMRDSHFMHYKSRDDAVEWRWYDNDAARYKAFEADISVSKQLEASYQGVCEEMFPLKQFGEKMFNCAQIPCWSKAVRIHVGRWKPFVLRFTFDEHNKNIINIELLAINSYYDQFPRNVTRVHRVNAMNVVLNGEEYKVSSLGEMNVYRSDEFITICWKFRYNLPLNIHTAYHYKTQIGIGQEIQFKQLLNYWKTNTLFEFVYKESSKSVSIAQSKKSKNDNKISLIKDITQYGSKYGYSSDENENIDREACIVCQMMQNNN